MTDFKSECLIIDQIGRRYESEKLCFLSPPSLNWMSCPSPKCLKKPRTIQDVIFWSDFKLNGSLFFSLSGHDGSVTSVSFSHDSRWLLTSSCDRTVRLWSPTHSDPLMVFSSVNHNFVSELDSSAKAKVCVVFD